VIGADIGLPKEGERFSSVVILHEVPRKRINDDFNTHKSKAHAAGARRPATRLHGGISERLAERLHALIPP
jgi:hypothetical protein